MPPEPTADCAFCPRLADFRSRNRRLYPDFHNAPVPSFGDFEARLLIVGLAPGLKGANRTGRPFTGDFAGDLLYPTLIELGLARGCYNAEPDDGLRLVGCRITNAVRCVPPENKPTSEEIRSCRDNFLAFELESLPNLRGVLALGRVAHESVLTARGLVRTRYSFAHGLTHTLPNGLALTDSYHCSRYNTSTRRLTPAMFVDAVRLAATQAGLV